MRRPRVHKLVPRRRLDRDGAPHYRARADAFGRALGELDAEIRAEGFYQNAVAAERAGDPFAGIRHDERALRANPAHEGAAHHLDLLRLRLWDDVEVLIDDGRRAFREEDLQLALDLWRRALLIDPENERAEAYVDRAERQLENLERLRSEPEDD